MILDVNHGSAVKAFLRRLFSSPITMFLFILAFAVGHHEACFATDNYPFLHTGIGCDLVGGLSLHGH
jgi:hypothetical protein